MGMEEPRGDAWSGEVEDKGREGACRARKGRRWRIPGTKGGRSNLRGKNADVFSKGKNSVPFRTTELVKLENVRE